MTEQANSHAAVSIPARVPRARRAFPIAITATIAVTALGAVLPWATVGHLSFNGTEGGGVLNLILAGVGLAAMLVARRRAWPMVVNMVCAALAGMVALLNLSDVGRLASGFDAVSVGSGLWISAAGTAAWVVTSALALVTRRRARG